MFQGAHPWLEWFEARDDVTTSSFDFGATCLFDSPASLDLRTASELQAWPVLAARWMHLEKCHRQVDQVLDFEYREGLQELLGPAQQVFGLQCCEWLRELQAVAPQVFGLECCEWLRGLQAVAPQVFGLACCEWLRELQAVAPQVFGLECCVAVPELPALAPQVFGLACCGVVPELPALAPQVFGLACCGVVPELPALARQVFGLACCGVVPELPALAPQVLDFECCGAVPELPALAPQVLDFECCRAVPELPALAPKILEIECCAVVPPEFAARQNHVVQSQQGFGAQHVASVGLAFWEQLCHVDQSLRESSVLYPDFPHQLTSLSFQSPRTPRCLILAPSGDLANPALPPNYSSSPTLALPNLVPHPARNLFLEIHRVHP